MTLVLVLEQRFLRTPDGRVWSPGPFRSSLWPRYLEVFSRLRVLARVREVPVVPSDWEPAETDAVTFATIPNYLGPWEYLVNIRGVVAAVRSAVNTGDAVILRVPSQLGNLLQTALRKRRQPFAVEVVGDPYDVFAPGVVEHALRPFFRWWFARRLKEVCARATAALYVTERALQTRYPCPGYSVGVSDVELSAEDVRSLARAVDPERKSFTLCIVGSLAQLYKAPDVVIDAVHECVRRGLDLRLVIVGDGRYREALEARVAKLRLTERVTFRGHLASRPALREVLDAADLFVLPSRTEGLPRALVEAMARGLPCVGSAVGGIPELLDPEDLVPPGEVQPLAVKIHEVLADPSRLSRMSERNLKRASEFREDILHARRVAFLEYVRERASQAHGQLRGDSLRVSAA